MKALSKLWTRLLVLCVPAGLSGTLYVRGAFGANPEEVYISQSYAFLLITLAAVCVAAVVITEYAKRARASSQSILLPANTLFESEDEREISISQLSAAIFFLVAMASTIVFSVRYSQSQIHCWSERNPIATGFWSSRFAVSTTKCKQLAIAANVGDDGKAISPIFEYIPYLTDGILIVLVVIALIAVIRMGRELWNVPAASVSGVR